jgi:hypothetical protein
MMEAMSQELGYVTGARLGHCPNFVRPVS